MDGRADWSDRDIAGEIVRCEIYGQNCKNADCDDFFLKPFSHCVPSLTAQALWTSKTS